MHALKFTQKKIIIVNSPLFRTNGVRGTLDCANVKRIQNVLQTISSCLKVFQLCALPFPFSQDYLIHTVSADGTGLIYFSQAAIKLHQTSVSAHTSLPPASPHDFTLPLFPTTQTHIPRAGDIDALATSFWFLDTRAET